MNKNDLFYMAANNGDFVEVSYTGRIKYNNIVFDTTDEETAKNNKLYNKNAAYGPVTICIGNRELIKGLDDFLVGKETGKEYEVEVNAKDAFGEKNSRLYHLVNTAKFIKQNIRPYPGMQVNVDNAFGIVKTVSGGRTMVDFNHPLAGKEVIYKIKIDKIITDTNEKIKSYISKLMGEEIKFKFESNRLEIHCNVEEPLKKIMAEQLKKVIPEIEDVEFKAVEEEKKVGNKE